MLVCNFSLINSLGMSYWRKCHHRVIWLTMQCIELKKVGKSKRHLAKTGTFIPPPLTILKKSVFYIDLQYSSFSETMSRGIIICTFFKCSVIWCYNYSIFQFKTHVSLARHPWFKNILFKGGGVSYSIQYMAKMHNNRGFLYDDDHL